ncbi:hypothetical protein GALMADRAFT_1210676 [Galerina marginata CBS 339.88]|uniref:Uncharacterized protein n=1 Tax=Galerina marginata (strain CBS 339.88) TaxID=685588 RepID=A0A067SE85_GALM3|nr:hypothetical protein GALMADRAFT_1210676 [Galerina marginata CBS 339.88]
MLDDLRLRRQLKCEMRQPLQALQRTGRSLADDPTFPRGPSWGSESPSVTSSFSLYCAFGNQWGQVG